MNEKEKKLPRYFGARLPWSKRKLDDGTIIYKAYDLSNGPCLIIDNHWDTIIRIVMLSRKALRLAFRADVATAEELIKEAFRSQRGAFVSDYARDSFELGDMVWILFKDYSELVLQRVEISSEGISDFGNGAIYKLDDILLIQRRIPYDLIGDDDSVNINLIVSANVN